ncbi:MFS general substrate transporter [Amniculicola lignicola CBS 123094]|uniref:MFS general substrate transporter n=1 Tax=Amniculicola lignicola CBS 123094 TaxID=1392246 RepID=A0A6A5WKT3_9PLEO|nr:MFS general substrate transporter [Amniculicola lignicola CBS 123094]
MFEKWNSNKASDPRTQEPGTSPDNVKQPSARRKWHLGIQADPETDEVPGSVILLSKATKRNEPLGLHHARARTSASSLPSPYGPPSRCPSRGSLSHEKKRTSDGRFILEPQPDDSANDPLNWKQRRRDFALLSLGFYCMVGGGMTPILAAGFNDVAETYGVSVPQVALTTGLYMLGLGLGSVVASPTAILWGKRPVYLVAIVLFCLSSIWCALSPNYVSLVVARIVQGMAVSPVECLPSATVAEIFFLHERAYRLGIYTLLLLGGKNLVPLASAVIIQELDWRWVFWIVAMVAAFCFGLIFFCVPETFWDRTPRPRGTLQRRPRSPSPARRHRFHLPSIRGQAKKTQVKPGDEDIVAPLGPSATAAPRRVGFAMDNDQKTSESEQTPPIPSGEETPISTTLRPDEYGGAEKQRRPQTPGTPHSVADFGAPVPAASQIDIEKQSDSNPDSNSLVSGPSQEILPPIGHHSGGHFVYTDYYRSAPRKSYISSLKPFNGRLVDDRWVHVMLRPFILFAYPAVLWSSLVYSLAIGWLIVLSESVAEVYRDRESYNFTALQVGLVYISPFVGGVLGTAVAGKISDLMVRYMSRKNDGVYEPEFRLVMAIPIAISTTIGLMGFGWSAEERDNWIVPTVFFGVISFGCSLGSTTAVTFVVDSYRVYAGEALVTLNFCKNILHGFIFSLFFTHWLEADGSKKVFLAVGGIQLGCMLFSIPMYIYGKRARMWTVRKHLMDKF